MVTRKLQNESPLYRGEVLSVEGSRFTFYAADFGFIEEVKKKRAKEIPESLDLLKTTNYFGKALTLTSDS